MNKLYGVLLLSIISLSFGFIDLVSAITPSLSLSTGTGDNVTVNVTGDPNSSVLLGYTKTGEGLQLPILGNTNSTGYFSSTISSGSYGISSGSSVYVRVNGQQSSTVSWPSVSTSQGSLVLSSTGVVLAVGQSSIVTANNNSLYLSNNSNSQVANVNISGSQITITGNTNGTTTATVCAQGGSSCSSIYVTVQNTGTQSLSFSQSNITISSGQTVPVTISGGTGLYMISNNPNSNIVQASLSGSILNLSTTSTSGTSSITICSTNMAACGIVNVTVGATSSASLSFSQNSPALSLGQTTSVVLSGGGSNSYYVSSNSNNNAIQTTLSSNILTLHGLSSGSSIITVCSSVNSCNTLTATVNYVSTGGSISLSQNSLSLTVGQTVSITVSGGDAPYNLPSNGGSTFTAVLNGNILNITGNSSGSSTIPVCSSGGGCINLSVSVSGTGSLQPVLSKNSISLEKGQSGTVSITNTGSFYVSNNSNQNIASVSVSGNTITISALNGGTSSANICQSGGQCTVLSVTVTNPSSTGNITVKSTSFLSFSDRDPIVGVGKTGKVAISGGSGTYSIVYNSNPSTVNMSISGNDLNLNGLVAGTSVVVICSSSGNACGAVSVTVGAATTVVDSVKINPSSVSLKIGKASIAILSGGNGSYSLGNYDKGLVIATAVRNSLLIIGRGVGTANIPVCSGGKCSNLSVAVSGNPSPSVSVNKYLFKSTMSYGDSGNEVEELQKRLSSEGFYKSTITGKFDSTTLSAVRSYQSSKGIRQTGNVGEETMKALNN